MRRTDQQNHLDRTTSARLAKLAGRAVDTSRLEARVARALREAAISEPAANPPRWRPTYRLTAAVAAAVGIVVALGWFTLIEWKSPALATPARLAQIHAEVAKGLAPHMKVSSVAEANRLLAARSRYATPLPELPGAIRSCCLHQCGDATLTCALIEMDGRLITVAMAEGEAVRSPPGHTVTSGQRRFIVHTDNDVLMVTDQNGGRWLCVMGKATTQQLVNVATQIRPGPVPDSDPRQIPSGA